MRSIQYFYLSEHDRAHQYGFSGTHSSETRCVSDFVTAMDMNSITFVGNAADRLHDVRIESTALEGKKNLDRFAFFTDHQLGVQSLRYEIQELVQHLSDESPSQIIQHEWID